LGRKQAGGRFPKRKRQNDEDLLSYREKKTLEKESAQSVKRKVSFSSGLARGEMHERHPHGT